MSSNNTTPLHDATHIETVELLCDYGANPNTRDHMGLPCSWNIWGNLPKDQLIWGLAQLIAAGADVLVAGNAVFGSADPLQAIAQIRNAAAK